VERSPHRKHKSPNRVQPLESHIKDIDALEAEQNYQESIISESLDEEIYKEHYS
jgi:hypothetical protein